MKPNLEMGENIDMAEANEKLAMQEQDCHQQQLEK